MRAIHVKILRSLYFEVVNNHKDEAETGDWSGEDNYSTYWEDNNSIYWDDNASYWEDNSTYSEDNGYRKHKQWEDEY